MSIRTYLELTQTMDWCMRGCGWSRRLATFYISGSKSVQFGTFAFCFPLFMPLDSGTSKPPLQPGGGAIVGVDDCDCASDLGFVASNWDVPCVDIFWASFTGFHASNGLVVIGCSGVVDRFRGRCSWKGCCTFVSLTLGTGLGAIKERLLSSFEAKLDIVPDGGDLIFTSHSCSSSGILDTSFTTVLLFCKTSSVVCFRVCFSRINVSSE